MEHLAADAAEIGKRHAEVIPLSDPKDVFGRLLCRYIQLIKLHRNISFGQTKVDSALAPSSTFLTSLTAAAYENQARRPHANHLDLLLDVVETMPNHYMSRGTWGNTEEWVIDNPTAPGDNLASAMNTPERQSAFHGWRRKLQSDLGNLFDAIESRSGIDQVHRLVESSFGQRAAGAIQANQVQRQETQRQSGRATIITAAGLAVSTTSRAHTFFGADE
jgi:hypothetical protein